MRKATRYNEAGPDPRAPARRGTKVIEFLVILALFLAGVIWFGGAYANRDPLWFRKTFNEQPTLVRINYYGTTRELRPGEPGFAEFVTVLNKTIPNHSGYIQSLYPRDASLEYYRTKGYSIELEYADPVLVHTHQYFPPARRLMIAIDGSFNYTNANILFRGSPERYLPGGLALENIDALRAEVERLLAQS